MKRANLLSAAIFMAMAGVVSAQTGVGIGTVSPDASSAMDITSTGAGFLIPRMTTAQRDAIAQPANGLAIFNTTTNNTETNTGTPAVPVWTSGVTDNIYSANGTLNGNRTVTQGSSTLAFTSTAVNSFSVDGTTFSVDAANNRVGFGTAAPTQALDVNGQLRVQALPDVTVAYLANPASITKVSIDATATAAIASGGSTSYTLLGTAGEVTVLVNANACGDFWSYTFNYNTVTNFIQFSYSGSGVIPPTWTGTNAYSLAGNSPACIADGNQAGMPANITLSTNILTIANVNNLPRQYTITECKSQKPVLNGAGLPVYANNAAAVAGGLAIGAFYRTVTGDVKVRALNDVPYGNNKGMCFFSLIAACPESSCLGQGLS